MEGREQMLLACLILGADELMRLGYSADELAGMLEAAEEMRKKIGEEKA